MLYFVTLLINYLVTYLLARFSLKGRAFILRLAMLADLILMSIKVTYVNMHNPPQEIKFLAEYSAESYINTYLSKRDYYSIFGS